MSREDQTQLQQNMDNKSKLANTLSNTEKHEEDSEKGITGNLKN